MLFRNRPRNPSLQRHSAISRGLVGAWLFDEGGGTAVRETVYGNQLGTLTGVTWSPGTLGIRPQFVNNTHIDTNEPDRYQFAGGRFTVVMRLKPGAIVTHHGFLSTLNYAGDTGWLIRSNSATTYKIVIGNTLYDLNVGSTISPAGWTNLALTMASNGQASSYYNGKYVASVGIKPIADSGRNLYIGKEQGTAYGFVGGWDSLLIYDRVLSPIEIRALSADIYLPFRASILRNLKAVAAGATTIRLTWTDNSEHEDGFSIERKTDAGAFAGIDTVAADVETYDDVSVPTGHTYTYRVRATDAVLGNSEYSNEAAETV